MSLFQKYWKSQFLNEFEWQTINSIWFLWEEDLPALDNSQGCISWFEISYLMDAYSTYSTVDACTQSARVTQSTDYNIKHTYWLCGPEFWNVQKHIQFHQKRSLHQKNILENSLRFNFLGLQHFYVPHFFDHKGALGEWFITDRNVFAKEVCWFFPISSVDEQ